MVTRMSAISQFLFLRWRSSPAAPRRVPRAKLRFALPLFRLSLCLVLCICSLRANAEDQTCSDDCCLASRVTVDGEELVRRGMSTFRRWGFKVFTGALYAPTGVTSREAILDGAPKKLILCYHRSLTIDQFIENSEDILDDNPNNDLEQMRSSLNRINSLYVPVKKGDTYAITYEPRATTMRLFFNERELGSFVDPSFARAYFGIWLSDYSVSERFTAGLYGD